MGNIHREVVPFNDRSRFRKDAKAVNRISRHQPVIPHLIKFFHKFFIELGCPDIMRIIHLKLAIKRKYNRLSEETIEA